MSKKFNFFFSLIPEFLIIYFFSRHEKKVNNEFLKEKNKNRFSSYPRKKITTYTNMEFFSLIQVKNTENQNCNKLK